MNPQATIYLCDDDEDVRGGLSFLLHEAGFDVRALAAARHCWGR
jgi:FixJ family two-component response regulator